MLYILSGPDDFSLGQSLEDIKHKIGDQTMLAANTTTLDGHQITVNELRTVCESVPFLVEKRLVIIKGLLERFEPRSRSSRQKKVNKVTNQPDGYQSLGNYISQTPDSTVLVLTEGGIKSNNPLFRMLARKAVVMSFPLLRDTKLRHWLQQRVAEEGGNISPQAVELLINLVGSNLWIMASEIDKLLLYALGRRIEEEDVQTVVGYAQQVNVFTMVDAIIGFKARLAEELLQQLLQGGAVPPYLLVMLSRQIRMIVRAKELKKQGITETETQNKLGLTSEFAVRKTLQQANRYSLPRLKQVYQQLLETDLSIKTGKYDGELALNILIAELCQPRKV